MPGALKSGGWWDAGFPLSTGISLADWSSSSRAGTGTELDELEAGALIVPVSWGTAIGSECVGELRSLGGSTGTRVVTAAVAAMATTSLARASTFLVFLSLSLSKKVVLGTWLSSEELA